MKIEDFNQYLNDRFAGSYRLHLIVDDGSLICDRCVSDECENIKNAILTGTADGWLPIGTMSDSWLENGERCDLCNRWLDAYSDEPGQ